MLNLILACLLIMTLLSPAAMAKGDFSQLEESVARNQCGSDESGEIIDKSTLPRSIRLQFIDKAYTIYFTWLNWFTALEHCRRHKQVFASITNDEDDLELMKALRPYENLNRTCLWLGASDLGHVGEFVWVSNGEPINYLTPWDRVDEPDIGENCLRVNPEGIWSDEDCYSELMFVCEDIQ